MTNILRKLSKLFLLFILLACSNVNAQILDSRDSLHIPLSTLFDFDKEHSRGILAESFWTLYSVGKINKTIEQSSLEKILSKINLGSAIQNIRLIVAGYYKEVGILQKNFLYLVDFN